jgi:hypothetical protein
MPDSGNDIPAPPPPRLVGPLVIVVLTAYMMVQTLGLLYAVYKKWPRTAVTQETSGAQARDSTTAPVPGSTAIAGLNPDSAAGESVGRESDEQKPGSKAASEEPSPGPDVSLVLLLLAPLVGALGGTIHSLRSFYAYVGQGQLAWRWVARYLLLPFVGAALAEVFYIVIRAGFLAPSAGSSAISPWGICAISALVGLFTGNALNRLGKIADSLFDKASNYSDQLKTPSADGKQGTGGPADQGQQGNDKP